MPQFEPQFTPTDVDDFTAAFLDAVEWLMPEERDCEEMTTPTGFAPETVAYAKRVCAAFQEQNAALLSQAYELKHSNGNDYNEASAGHDLWLDSTGSGVGFWDRGFNDLGDELSKAAKAALSYPSAYTGDDGLIYIGGAESEPVI